jgi:hypothetical protein
VAAVALFALALFALGVAAVMGVLHDRRLALVAVVAAITLAVAAGGLAIAGAVRWRGCFRGANGVDVRAVGNTTAICPQRTLGIRDPF